MSGVRWRRAGRDGRGGSSQGEVRSAVRNAPACGARGAGRGVRGAVPGSPRSGHSRDAAARRGRRWGLAQTRGLPCRMPRDDLCGWLRFPGQSPSRGAALPAPALNPAVPAGERESGGKRVK